jgi:hypothetical protein
MPRKLFIVAPGNERLLAALRSAMANEPDVEIFFDRRGDSRSQKWHGTERRAAPDDMCDRIRRDGFAVVRPSPPRAAEQNIRWA